MWVLQYFAGQVQYQHAEDTVNAMVVVLIQHLELDALCSPDLKHNYNLSYW